MTTKQSFRYKDAITNLKKKKTFWANAQRKGCISEIDSWVLEGEVRQGGREEERIMPLKFRGSI